MAGSMNAHRKPIRKVKTGCVTCRVRKVKCDEGKPSCQRCRSTGRTCDGYASPFVLNTRFQGTDADINLRNGRRTSAEIGPEDIDLLNRYFSTKTLHGVKLECNEEARQILEASLTDPAIQQALSSLRTLRDDLETSGDGPRAVAQPSPSHNYGLLQYSMALGGLASRLSSPSASTVRSALLCAQIFVAVEQLRRNYASMASHIVRGLDIMHKYQTRPYLDDASRLMPALYEGMPSFDVFLLKLSLAPCKFAEPLLKPSNGTMDGPGCPITPEEQSASSSNHRVIAPDSHTALRKIAASTIGFLGRLSQLKSQELVQQMLSEKAALLKSLKSWLEDLELVYPEEGHPHLEPITVSFLRFHHSTLRIILFGALTSSEDQDTALLPEHSHCQTVANNISERVRNYTVCDGTRTGG